MSREIVHEKEYEEIQIAAEKVQAQYNKVLKESPEINPIFGEEKLNKLTEDLVKLIISYPSKEFKGNESMYKVFVYITKTIPKYTGVDGNGTPQKYFSFFRTYYNNDYDNIGLTEIDDHEDWNNYGRNEFNRLNDDKTCSKIKSIMGILESKGVEIFGESDETMDQLVDIVYDEKYAGNHADEFKKKHRKEIKHHLMIIFKYGYVKYFNPNDVTGYGEVSDSDFGKDEVDLIDRIDENPEETIGFFRLLAKFSSNYVTKRNRERLHCLFTNEVASGLREYVEEGTDDEEDAKGEEQWKISRALSLEDSFASCRNDIYESLLHRGYLGEILEDNTPNSLDRISGVCLDRFQIQEGKQKKFISENVAKFLNVDKGTISNLRKTTYNDLKSDLMEWYGFKK